MDTPTTIKQWRAAIWFEFLPIDIQEKTKHHPCKHLQRSANKLVSAAYYANANVTPTARLYPHSWAYRDKYGMKVEERSKYFGPNGGEYEVLYAGKWYSIVIQRRSKKGIAIRKPMPRVFDNRGLRLVSYTPYFELKHKDDSVAYQVSKLTGGPAWMKVV